MDFIPKDGDPHNLTASSTSSSINNNNDTNGEDSGIMTQDIKVNIATLSSTNASTEFGGCAKDLYGEIIRYLEGGRPPSAYSNQNGKVDPRKLAQFLNTNYSLKDGLLLHEGRYVIQKEDTGSILTDIHVKLLHPGYRRMWDAARGLFSHAPRHGSLSSDISKVLNECEKCRSDGNTRFKDTLQDAEFSVVPTPEGPHLFRVDITGNDPSMPKQNTSTSSTDPDALFGGIPKTEYDDLVKFLAEKTEFPEFLKSCTSQRRKNFKKVKGLLAMRNGLLTFNGKYVLVKKEGRRVFDAIHRVAGHCTESRLIRVTGGFFTYINQMYGSLKHDARSTVDACQTCSKGATVRLTDGHRVKVALTHTPNGPDRFKLKVANIENAEDDIEEEEEEDSEEEEEEEEDGDDIDNKALVVQMTAASDTSSVSQFTRTGGVQKKGKVTSSVAKKEEEEKDESDNEVYGPILAPAVQIMRRSVRFVEKISRADAATVMKKELIDEGKLRQIDLLDNVDVVAKNHPIKNKMSTKAVVPNRPTGTDKTVAGRVNNDLEKSGDKVDKGRNEKKRKLDNEKTENRGSDKMDSLLKSGERSGEDEQINKKKKKNAGEEITGSGDCNLDVESVEEESSEHMETNREFPLPPSSSVSTDELVHATHHMAPPQDHSIPVEPSFMAVKQPESDSTLIAAKVNAVKRELAMKARALDDLQATESVISSTTMTDQHTTIGGGEEENRTRNKDAIVKSSFLQNERKEEVKQEVPEEPTGNEETAEKGPPPQLFVCSRFGKIKCPPGFVPCLKSNDVKKKEVAPNEFQLILRAFMERPKGNQLKKQPQRNSEELLCCIETEYGDIYVPDGFKCTNIGMLANEEGDRLTIEITVHMEKTTGGVVG